MEGENEKEKKKRKIRARLAPSHLPLGCASQTHGDFVAREQANVSPNMIPKDPIFRARERERETIKIRPRPQ